MINKIVLLYLIINIIFFHSNSFSLENKIVLKIENQIITSIDINNEYKYLLSLNPNIKNLKKDDIIKLSKKSILREKIKKIEIEKNFKDPKIPQEILNNILQNVYSRIGFNNLNDFKKYLIANDVDYENVKNKLEIEALWNELILFKFSSKVVINEHNLRAKVKKNKDKFLKSYLMSEIFFEVLNLKDLDSKFLEISETINNNGFDYAALKYSISQTSNIGGKLDWIKESSLNKNIIKAVKDLKINEFTKPIKAPGGFLILKINNIDNIKFEVDNEKELKKLVNFEKNNQLNQYSKIYFNRIKKNLQINEL
ncbi:peptidylprolyl isomerase [Pelagibacterales bacterium SAG-MED50]|nr:peptidylprolyl isomerase [Pelagibacterales bacterium SAG-MED50]